MTDGRRRDDRRVAVAGIIGFFRVRGFGSGRTLPRAKTSPGTWGLGREIIITALAKIPLYDFDLKFK